MEQDTNVANAINTSRIVTVFDNEFPDVDPTLYRIRGSQYQHFFRNVEDMGMKRVINNRTGKQYEEDWLHPVVHTSGPLTVVDSIQGIYSFVPSNATPNDFIMASDAYPYTPPSQFAQPVQKFDRLEMPTFDGNARASVIDVANDTTNTPVVTFKLSDPSIVLQDAEYIAGTAIMIAGNAYADGAEQPDGKVYRELQDTWTSQIIKSAFDITGSVLTRKTWYHQLSDSEGNITGYRVLGMKRMEYQHMRAIDDALLFEELTPNTIADTNTRMNEAVLTTEGLFPYGRRRGHTEPYLGGTWGYQQMDVTEKLIDSEQAPTHYQALMGIDFNQDLNQNMLNLFRNTQINYAIEEFKKNVFGDDDGKFTRVNFMYHKQGQVTYGFQRLPQLSDPRAKGLPGYNGPGQALFMPIGTMPDKRDPENKIPYMGMGYAAKDGYSRMAEVVDLIGASNGTHMQKRDVNNYGLKSEIAAMHCGGNTFIVWDREI